MKEYLLLRNNTQSGPYTLTELAQHPLRRTDLVWVEGESLRWEPVTERPELAGFIRTEERKTPIITQRAQPEAAPGAEALVVSPEIAVRPRAARPFRFQASERPRTGALWILSLFLCLVCSAVVVQKIIESGNPVAGASAVALATEPLPVQAEGSSNDAPAEFSYQNALKRESIRTEEGTEDDPAKLRLRELRRLVRLSVNAEKEGVFEGINDLQIRIHNSSPHTLDQVNVEVSYRLPGASNWHREQYSVYGVNPDGDKILVVPPVKRGAHVKYRLLGVESKAALEQTAA